MSVSVFTLYAQNLDVYWISNVNGSIILDGIPDEEGWKNIEPVPLFTHWPTFGDTVEKGLTEIRIGYDEDIFT